MTSVSALIARSSLGRVQCGAVGRLLTPGGRPTASLNVFSYPSAQTALSHETPRLPAFVPAVRHHAEDSTLDVHRFIRDLRGKYESIADLICVDLLGLRCLYALALCGIGAVTWAGVA